MDIKIKLYQIIAKGVLNHTIQPFLFWFLASKELKIIFKKNKIVNSNNLIFEKHIKLLF